MPSASPLPFVGPTAAPAAPRSDASVSRSQAADRQAADRQSFGAALESETRRSQQTAKADQQRAGGNRTENASAMRASDATAQTNPVGRSSQTKPASDGVVSVDDVETATIPAGEGIAFLAANMAPATTPAATGTASLAAEIVLDSQTVDAQAVEGLIEDGQATNILPKGLPSTGPTPGIDNAANIGAAAEQESAPQPIMARPAASAVPETATLSGAQPQTVALTAAGTAPANTQSQTTPAPVTSEKVSALAPPAPVRAAEPAAPSALENASPDVVPELQTATPATTPSGIVGEAALLASADANSQLGQDAPAEQSAAQVVVASTTSFASVTQQAEGKIKLQASGKAEAPAQPVAIDAALGVSDQTVVAMRPNTAESTPTQPDAAQTEAVSNRTENQTNPTAARQNTTKSAAKVGSPAAALKASPEAARPFTAPALDAAPRAPVEAMSAAPAAPSTTATASQPAPAHTPPTVPMQVATRIIERADGRAQRFEISLQPEELGRVDVRIEIGADKRVHAVLAAHDSAALTDLVRGQRALERALADAGIELGDAGLKFELADDKPRGGAFARNDDADTHVWRGFSERTVQIEPTDLPAARTWRSGRLDLVA